MKLSARLYKFLFWVAGVVILTLAGIFMVIDPFYIRATTDAKLIDIFIKNKEQFVKLHEMMISDSESYISKEHIDEKIEKNRKLQYLDLLSKIGNPKIFSNKKLTKYIYDSGGLLAIGPEWQKGIQYGEDGCDEVTNLDSPRIFPEDTRSCRKIEANTWLIFEKIQ